MDDSMDRPGTSVVALVAGLAAPAAVYGFTAEGVRPLAANAQWDAAAGVRLARWEERLDEACWRCRAERLPVVVQGESGPRWFWVLAPLFDAEFRVPRVLVTISEAEAEAGAVPPSAAPSCGRPVVLVVDDSTVTRMFATVAVQSLGCDVLEAVDGIEGVAVAARTPSLAAILMDIEMPILDGLTATRVIRALPPSCNTVPMIGITASDQRKDLDEGLAAGMNACLPKPVEAQLLRRVLSQWIPHLSPPAPAAGGSSGAMPESVLPEPVLPEPVLPEPVLPEPVLPEPVLPEPVLIDEEHLADLFAAVRPQEVGNIVACFLRDISSRLDRLARAAAVRDGAHMAREAHDLSSTAGSFGAQGVMAMASALETLCRQGALDAALARLPALQAAAAALVAEIKRRQAAGEGPPAA